VSRKMQPATEDDAIMIGNAIKAMRDARYWLRAAGAVKTLERLQATMRSADGARRHVGHRIRRTAEGRLESWRT
jgi:hypothetical protein